MPGLQRSCFGIGAMCTLVVCAWAAQLPTIQVQSEDKSSTVLLPAWHSQTETVGGLPIMSFWFDTNKTGSAWHSQNETVGGLPIHSFWFDTDKTGCRKVEKPALVRSAFAGMAPQHVSLPSCVSEAFTNYVSPLTEPVMREARSQLGVGALFILHYPKLVSRKRQVEKLLSEHALTGAAAWVEWDGLLSSFGQNESMICCIFDCQSEWWGGVETGTKDLSLRHLYAIYQVYQLGLEQAVILEDDPSVVGQAKVATVIREVAQQGPANATAIMLGGTRMWQACENSHSLAVDGHSLVGPGYGARTAGAYLITQAGARLILGKMFATGQGINNPADLIMDGAINIGCYWLEPPLLNQTMGGGAGATTTSREREEKLL